MKTTNAPAALVATLSLVIALLATGGAAYASDVRYGASIAQEGRSSAAVLSPADEEHFREVWTKYGVPVATQDSLIAKFESGIAWDSIEGSAPTSSTTSTRSGTRTTVNHFADGSITVVDVQTLPSTSGVRPMADLQQCSLQSQAPYVNKYRCLVHTNVVYADFYYTVYFQLVLNGYDSVTSASGLSITTYGGTASGQYVRVTQRTETAGSGAQAAGGFKFTSIGGVTSKDFILLFNVRHDSYSASNN